MTELTPEQIKQACDRASTVLWRFKSGVTGDEWTWRALARDVLALTDELSEANTKIENGLEALLAEGQTAQVRWANAFRVLAGSRCFKKAEDVIE
jgi:hypothetical protein